VTGDENRRPTWLPPAATAYLAAQAAEYGTYVATRTIYYEGVRAYNEGDPVPVSNVERHGYLEQGLVRRAVEELAALKARRDADAAASQRVIIIYCDDASHDRIDLAALVTHPQTKPKQWVADDRAEHQQLVHPADNEAAPGMLHFQGHVTERVRIACNQCPLDVILGDRLGQGYETMVAWRAADSRSGGYRTKPERRDVDKLTPSADGQAIPKPVPASAMRPDLAVAAAMTPTPATDFVLHQRLSRWADRTADDHGVSSLSLRGLGYMLNP